MGTTSRVFLPSTWALLAFPRLSNESVRGSDGYVSEQQAAEYPYHPLEEGGKARLDAFIRLVCQGFTHSLLLFYSFPFSRTLLNVNMLPLLAVVVVRMRRPPPPPSPPPRSQSAGLN